MLPSRPSKPICYHRPMPITNNSPSVKELHDRAAESAKETRSTIIKLASAAVGVLFFIVTRQITPSLTDAQILSLILAMTLIVLSLGSAILSSFSDAQWSYWWGVESDQTQTYDRHQIAPEKKKKWHIIKDLSEKSMLIFFVLSIVMTAFFVILRI